MNGVLPVQRPGVCFGAYRSQQMRSVVRPANYPMLVWLVCTRVPLTLQWEHPVVLQCTTPHSYFMIGQVQ